jgi:Holliday junction resolvase
MLLFKEWRAIGIKIDLEKWYLLQIDFLNQHKYYSNYSISKRNNKKNQTLKEIIKLLNN